ncbi:MAG: 1-acyl-sn-glycerol-3-phosphate acyltransferase [Gemmatimonadetes bacterium]|uniref:1-acyl-sn-glycerol-3-phosphate acyltransferase n=1 Tax=Candidatus Kutchimonas denitrificans TaxID=3056748 RepID=A0AAE5CAK0_9BACT|nr:1-acyl-sn-glycerol-3-phosphate acyltransferase [Gemmatimonadota bacterium]NIR76591.1 1-acyl-sn-glycerol-3-phosphate acyltransferase [Candidatus Kutchimonas denitrificans]NIS01147.1 1-acyl-sn-glycerol-3-phosphate acyltransferase [Gemmatimonadota bacterium]NIT66914.1 1-acyl-sn-glycerol-3-phosphate acyltransferase [Gemmatimonadota bacterium]NIU54687.1 1-acylglycerol-3-phosphate O-acyltransferase [Gemmatimonadota bacterium]
MGLIRSIWTVIVASSVLATLGTVCIVGAYVGLSRSFYDWTGKFFSHVMLWASGTPVTAIGLEHIDRDDPQVVACNHQSMWDVWTLAATVPRRTHFVAKKEIRKIPIFGRAAAAAGHVYIDRGNRAAAVQSLKLAGRRIRENNSTAVVFPEGTRSLTGDLQPFKKGPFIMAIEAGVPIVPTVVDGTFDILPKRGFVLRPQPITVWFGEPVDTTNFEHEDRDALIARVHARMAEMLAELRAPDGYRGPKRLRPEPAALEESNV